MAENGKWKGFGPVDLLVPKDCDMTKWSVVACDQYTSQPDYWRRVDAFVGDAPSARKLILPEAFLSDGHMVENSRRAHETMEAYLRQDLFRRCPDALIYVERWLSNGRLRRGIVGGVDLEEYDYHGMEQPLIRATEGTVLSRIPPRMAVRRDAALELSHVMLLVDDPEQRIIEHLTYETEDMELLYDFDLMEEGGHITGYLLTEEQKEDVRELLAELDDQERFEQLYDAPRGSAPMLFAVGDGNHSLATAKAVYQERKEQHPEQDWSHHPSRWAMVELNNLHDESLEFEAIHRVFFQTDPEELLREFLDYYPGTYAGVGEGHVIHYVWARGEGDITVPNPDSQLAVGTLQGFLDYFAAKNPGKGYVDYVHGEDVTRTLGTQEGNIGFLLQPMAKEQLFKGVIHDGALPRKTFSMGSACDKRFYLEARKIR